MTSGSLFFFFSFQLFLFLKRASFLSFFWPAHLGQPSCPSPRRQPEHAPVWPFPRLAARPHLSAPHRSLPLHLFPLRRQRRRTTTRAWSPHASLSSRLPFKPAPRPARTLAGPVFPSPCVSAAAAMFRFGRSAGEQFCAVLVDVDDRALAPLLLIPPLFRFWPQRCTRRSPSCPRRGAPPRLISSPATSPSPTCCSASTSSSRHPR